MGMPAAYRAKQGSDILQLPVHAWGGIMAPSDVIQLVLIRWGGGEGAGNTHISNWSMGIILLDY